jgi:small conductance mechanosensitive channel
MEMLKDLQEIDPIRIVAIITMAWAIIAVSQRLLPWLAEHFSGRRRLYILAAVPVLRLTIIITVVILIITHIMEPILQNLIALLGAIGLALGFALKDYLSSQVAGIVTLFEMPYQL